MIIRKVCHKCHCGKPSHDKLMKMANMVEGYNNQYLSDAIKAVDEAIKAMAEQSPADFNEWLNKLLNKPEEAEEAEEPKYYVSDAMHDLMMKFAEELNHYVVVSTENLNDLKKTVASFKEMMLRSKHIDEQEQSN
jgi:predicted phage tail protein